MKKSIKGLNHKFFKNITLLNSLGICAACNSNNTVNKHNQENVKGGSSKDNEEDTPTALENDNEEDTDEIVGSRRKGENYKNSEFKLYNKKSPDFEPTNDSEQSIDGSEKNDNSNSNKEIFNENESLFLKKIEYAVNALNRMDNYSSFIPQLVKISKFIESNLPNNESCKNKCLDIFKEKLNFKFLRNEHNHIDFICGKMLFKNISNDSNLFLMYTIISKCLLDSTDFANKYKIDLSIYKGKWYKNFCSMLKKCIGDLSGEGFVNKIFYFNLYEDERILSGWKKKEDINDSSIMGDFEVEQINDDIKNKINTIYTIFPFIFDFNSYGKFNNVVYSSEDYLSLDFISKFGLTYKQKLWVETAIENFGLDEFYYTNSEISSEDKKYIEEHISDINTKNRLLKNDFFVFKNRYFKFFYSFEDDDFNLFKGGKPYLKYKPTIFLGKKSIFFRNKKDNEVEFKFYFHNPDTGGKSCMLSDIYNRLGFLLTLKAEDCIDIEQVKSNVNPEDNSWKIGNFDLLNFEFQVDDYCGVLMESLIENIINIDECINEHFNNWVANILDEELLGIFDSDRWHVESKGSKIELHNMNTNTTYYLKYNTDTRKLEFVQ